MFTAFPFDIDNPPIELPPGGDRLVWRLAHALRMEHEAGSDGMCLASVCRRNAQLHPCPTYALARGGFGFVALSLVWPNNAQRRYPRTEPAIRLTG